MMIFMISMSVLTLGDLVDVGVKMTVARLGTSLVMELMRVLEGARGRLSSDNGGQAQQGV